MVLGGRIEDGELGFGWEAGVEREREELGGAGVEGGGAFGDCADCSLDLFPPSQEYEDIAVTFLLSVSLGCDGETGDGP